MVRIHLALFTLISAVGLARVAAADPPAITWGSDPVKPNETVVLLGGGFDRGVAELGKLPNTPARRPAEATALTVDRWQPIAPLQSGPACVKFVVPAERELGVYACRFHSAEAVSNTILLNAPDPWWLQGDLGESASPGGSLRVFGKCLVLDPLTPPLVALTAEKGAGKATESGTVLQLKPREACAYALRIELPKDLACGTYRVAVHNGFGGDRAWSAAGRLVVAVGPAWKTDVFNVKDFGADPGKALLAALAKAGANGGGTVYLPRGRYPVRDRLVIPNNTVLQGESTELVSLYWPDFDKPPPELVAGVNFGIQSLSLYCQNYSIVVGGSDQSDGMFLRRVRIRADGYFMMADPNGKFRNRRGTAEWNQCGDAVRLRGKNFEVTDCDIYASGRAIFSFFAHAGVIARNRIHYGRRGYGVENADRLIFEDNRIVGASPLALGNDISTFYRAYCRNIWFARNHIEEVFGGDRETMTLDAAGGATGGTPVSVDGLTLTLAKEPVYRTYAPKPLADWRGAAVMIVQGKGAVQYRLATRHQGPVVEVDRPWMIAPDRDSQIQIGPFRGHNLFIGNTITDGGAFQLYAAAHDSIVAENRGVRMDGFSVWGLNPHGWGLQPSWFCQFLDNEIVEGNGYGAVASSFGTVGFDESGARPGPLVRGAIFRRNRCDNNASIAVRGLTADVLVEHCALRHCDRGIVVQPSTDGVLLRENTFDDVAQPIVDEGHRALVK